MTKKNIKYQSCKLVIYKRSVTKEMFARVSSLVIVFCSLQLLYFRGKEKDII